MAASARTPITFTVPLRPAARTLALELSAEGFRTGTTPPTLTAVEDAITRWLVARAEDDLDRIAQHYTDRGPAGLQLRAALETARRLQPATGPKLYDAGARRQAARQFAAAHGEPVRAWMLWPRWADHIGCDECAEKGPAAECWGAIGCHGYAKGCGCELCTAIDTQEQEKQGQQPQEKQSNG